MPEALRWVERFPVDKGVQVDWSRRRTCRDPNPRGIPGLSWILGGALAMALGIAALKVWARLRGKPPAAAPGTPAR